jgi:hypothetical protein
VDAFLAGKPADGVALYRRFEDLALSVGEVVLAPARTRIGFQRGRIFAAVNAVRPGRIDVHIVTRRPIRSPRIRRVESLSPTDHVNPFTIEAPAQIDAEVRRWLQAGYRWGLKESARGREEPRRPARDGNGGNRAEAVGRRGIRPRPGGRR